MTTSEPGPFAAATAVHRSPVEGRYDGAVAEGWDIGGNTNGGYLLAVVARALADATGRPDPVSLTAHYLSPGRVGPVEVETAVIRSGRRFATARATLIRDGKPLVTALGMFGDVTSADDEPAPVVDGGPPDLPAPEDLLAAQRSAASVSFAPALNQKVEVLLHPDDIGFVVGRPSGTARVRGWFRLRDDEPIDTVALTLAVDAFPPAIFNSGIPMGWVPTLELTTHIRARPAPGWLACTFTTRFVTGGFLEEDGEIWDSTGRLVAQSRQLALVPRPGPLPG